MRGTIPVRINPLFWFVIFLIGWVNSSSALDIVIWMGVIFFSVLAHEYGHALTARYFGHTAKIELYALGGVTERQGPPLKAWQEFVVVINGPLAGIALSILAFWLRLSLAGDSGAIIKRALEITVAINLFWTLLNLLPVYPLDGGQLLRIVLQAALGVRGVKIALFLSFCTAFAFALFFMLYKLVLIGAVFFILAFEGFRAWKGGLSMSDSDSDPGLQELLSRAQNKIASKELVEAEKLLVALLAKARRGLLYRKATELLGLLYAEEGLYEKAYDYLQREEKNLTPKALVEYQKAAFALKHYKKVILIGSRLYAISPSYETALLNSISHSILGEFEPAIGWLRASIKMGLSDIETVLDRAEYDGIRNSPEFEQLRADFLNNQKQK